MDCNSKFDRSRLGTFLLALIVLSVLPMIVVRPQTKTKTSEAVPNRGPEVFEVGQAQHLKALREKPTELKVVSYNIRWRGGAQLRELIKLLRTDSPLSGASLIGLQEVDRKKKRTQNENTAKAIADELGMYYAWTSPPKVKPESEEETGVAIFSPYPLMDIEPMVLPHEGPGGRHRVAMGVTVTIGGNSLRFYSVHAETRISVDHKAEQLQAVMRDAEKYSSKPVIILGDFNTWEGSAVKKTHKLFEPAGFQTPFDDQPTFFRKLLFFPLELKLDWIWVRNAETVKFGVERNVSLSDHWPLWAVVKLGRGPNKTGQKYTEFQPCRCTQSTPDAVSTETR